MSMLRTEAIKNFLVSNTKPDLASLYSHDMECQVNVAQDNGVKIQGEYQGKIWNGYTDGVTEWKPIRIPFNARSEPIYQDRPMKFSLAEHAEGIGMTGWDWKNRVSRWVAFDFDAMIGHSERHPTKLTLEELNAVKEAAMQLPWTTLRRSTSGKGLHIYVFLPEVPTANHTEHAALARGVLHYMCARTGFPFESQVDICGGNMWVWHRKMAGTDGLTLIKQGKVLDKVPMNWKDHLDVVSGKRRRVMPNVDDEDVISQKRHVALDEEHQALINYLDKNGASFWWNQDYHMLVAHTYDLLCAHRDLGMRSVFKTVATGSERGTDHNCFLFPLRRGAWVVRRYGKGVEESDTWEQDNKGFTRCYLNQQADLRTACKANDGVEHTTGGFLFTNGKKAMDAAAIMGIDLAIPEEFRARETLLKKHKDGRLVVTFKRDSGDNALSGWLCDKTNKFTKIIDHKIDDVETIDVDNFDDLIRHLVSEGGTNLGWVVRSEKQWTDEPLSHLTVVLKSMGLRSEEINTIVGNCVLKPWQLVNRPFEPEYVGDRSWNRQAAQFRFAPNLDKDVHTHPTWDLILHHIGHGLTDAILEHPWCKGNGIVNGADYLRCWAASMFQKPYEQLPYLFLWGEQNTGKSILHEALGLLMTRGYVRADMALQSQFNGELEQAVLCVVEETDLQANTKAYNMIKDYVTGLQVSLHVKGATPVMIPNTTHWIQCANEPTACPIFHGDTRVTVVNVPILQSVVPKRDLLSQLQKEAPDFLASLLRLELPRSEERLNLPAIETKDKRAIARSNETLLETYINENCYKVDGHMITIGDFYTNFIAWLEPSERVRWTKQKISKTMHPSIPKGRNPHNSEWCYGNITFDENAKPYEKLVLSEKGDRLVPIH